MDLFKSVEDEVHYNPHFTDIFSSATLFYALVICKFVHYIINSNCKEASSNHKGRYKVYL